MITSSCRGGNSDELSARTKVLAKQDPSASLNIDTAQRLLGRGTPIVHNVFYPAANPSDWQLHEDERCLRLLPSFKDNKRAFNGLNIATFFVRMRIDKYQNWARLYKQANTARWTGATLVWVPSDRESATGYINIG
jgi:hypothetical protein